MGLVVQLEHSRLRPDTQASFYNHSKDYMTKMTSDWFFNRFALLQNVKFYFDANINSAYKITILKFGNNLQYHP